MHKGNFGFWIKVFLRKGNLFVCFFVGLPLLFSLEPKVLGTWGFSQREGNFQTARVFELEEETTFASLLPSSDEFSHLVFRRLSGDYSSLPFEGPWRVFSSQKNPWLLSVNYTQEDPIREVLSRGQKIWFRFYDPQSLRILNSSFFYEEDISAVPMIGRLYRLEDELTQKTLSSGTRLEKEPLLGFAVELFSFCGQDCRSTPFELSISLDGQLLQRESLWSLEETKTKESWQIKEGLAWQPMTYFRWSLGKIPFKAGLRHRLRLDVWDASYQKTSTSWTLWISENYFSNLEKE